MRISGIGVSVAVLALMSTVGVQGSRMTAQDASVVAEAKRKADALAEVTVTGCLRPTDLSANRPGTSLGSGGDNAGTAGRGEGSGFVLKEAVVLPEGKTAASGGGTTGTNPGASSGREFRVVVPGGVSLDDHVNKQVQIRGRLSTEGGPASAASQKAADGTASHGATHPTPSGSGGSLPTVLTVISITGVASECRS
jgi:hypothetical protein